MINISYVNDLLTAIVGIGGIFGVNHFFPLLKKDEPIIKDVVDQGIKDVEGILSLPVAKTVEVHLKQELSSLQSGFEKTEVGRLALVGLHAFGKALSDLSETQKSALVMFIQQNIPADKNMSKTEIENAISEAQKECDKVGVTPMFTLATSFTEATKSEIQKEVST